MQLSKVLLCAVMWKQSVSYGRECVICEEIVLIMDFEDQLKTSVTQGFVSGFLLFGRTPRLGEIQQEADRDKRRVRWRKDNRLSELSHAFSFVLPLILLPSLPFLSLLDLSQVICFSSSLCPHVFFQYNMLIGMLYLILISSHQAFFICRVCFM